MCVFGVLLVRVIMSVLLLLAVLLAEKMNIHNGNMWKHRCLTAQSIPYHSCTIYLPTFGCFFMVNVDEYKIYTIHGCYGDATVMGSRNPLDTWMQIPGCTILIPIATGVSDL